MNTIVAIVGLLAVRSVKSKLIIKKMAITCPIKQINPPTKNAFIQFFKRFGFGVIDCSSCLYSDCFIMFLPSISSQSHLVFLLPFYFFFFVVCYFSSY